MEPDKFSLHKANTPEYVCNTALSYLGRAADLINNLEVDALRNQCARTCLLHYDRTRRTFLADHTWSFALKEMELVEYIPTISDSKSLANSYIKPSDCLGIISVGSKTCGCTCTCACDLLRNEGYKILESRIIPCNGHWIRYIFDNNQLETWSPMAITAFALLLAREISGSVTLDSTFTNATLLSNAYFDALGEAKKRDSYSRKTRVRYSDHGEPVFKKPKSEFTTSNFF